MDWLAQILEEKGWKPADLARASKLDSAVISNIMNGSRKVGPKTGNAIARALDIPPEVLFRAAGLLPAPPGLSPKAERLLHLIDQLPEEDQDEVMDFVEMKLERKKRNEKKSSHQTGPANTTANP